MVVSERLEDARTLCERYDHMYQEVEAKVITSPLLIFWGSTSYEFKCMPCMTFLNIRVEFRSFVKNQAIEVSRRKAKSCEPSLDDIPEYRTNKVKDSETKLAELKSALATLGKEAAFAMVGVENQQQKLTLQRLIAMVTTHNLSI